MVLATTISIRSMRRPSYLRAGGGGAIGDAVHLLQDLAIEAAQEERIRGGAAIRARRRPRLRIEIGGAAVDVSSISRAIRWPC